MLMVVQSGLMVSEFTTFVKEEEDLMLVNSFKNSVMKVLKKGIVYTKLVVRDLTLSTIVVEKDLISTLLGQFKQVMDVLVVVNQISGMLWDHLKSLLAIDYIRQFMERVQIRLLTK